MSMWDPTGNDGEDRGSEDRGRSPDPYAADGTWRQGPYATSSHGGDPYGSGSADPYGTSGGYGTSGEDPYGASGAGPYGGGAFSSPSGPPAATSHGSVGPAYGPGPAWPASAPGYAPPLPTSAMALTGFIVGLVSLVLCSGLPAPIALVFSILGMRDTAPGAERAQAGRGFAIAGLVISILGTLMLAAVVVYLIVVFGAAFYFSGT